MTSKLLYHGTSMNPRLQEGDILQVLPYDGQEICVGDVVAFSHPEKPEKVIHRVVAVSSRGIMTRGDNNTDVDDWILKPGDLMGKVVAIQRQGRTLLVPQDVPVSLYVLQGRQWLDRAVSRLLHPLYHRLAQSGLFQGRLAAWMKPQLIYFSRSEGVEWQLWLGRLLIGRKRPHQSCWTIRRPFRLFLDEASLPSQPANFHGTNPTKS